MRNMLIFVFVLAGCSTATAPGVDSTLNPVRSSSQAMDQVAPAAPPSPTVGPARSVTISAAGDILIHPSLWNHAQADGLTFDRELAGAKPVVSAADYAICHVEQGFNDPESGMTQYPNYFTHPVLARSISATGFDACSTASNWTWLKGLDGIARTNRALRSAGVTPAGSRARADGLISSTEQVNGVTVAHLSYTDPGDSPGVEGADWAVNRSSARQIVADAEAARQAGAELVIVSLAMGQMGSSHLSDSQRRTVRTIARSHQVDLLVGHGAHVIQDSEQVDGMWAIWHGNLLSSFFPDQRRMHEGLVSTVTFEEQPDGRFAAKKAKGELVLSLPQTGRLIDISHSRCDVAPDRWQEAYDAARSTLATAIEQGFVLTRPCRA